MKRLVVVPTDPILAYEKKGLTQLEEYFNPMGFFDEVFIVSPFEEPDRNIGGLRILSVAAKHLYKTIDILKPQIVRAYGSFFSADLCCYNKLPNIPLIVSVHDTKGISPSLHYADMLLCMSGVVAERVADLGISKSKIRILPNRVDTEIFFPEDNKDSIIRNNFPSGKMILFVGRMTEQKNVDTLIKAISILPNDYFCVFIGKGSESYKHQAIEQSVADRCFWIDSVRNAELQKWYNACDCFCVPSRWEGFGIVFIEAAACGTLIVSSDIAPMNEFLQHNLNSILIKEYENPEKIANGILRICENKLLAEKLSKAARCMSMKFDKKAVDLLEVDIYREVLSKPEGWIQGSHSYGEKERIVDVLKHQNGKAVIFGAGSGGQKMHLHLNSIGIETAFFVDNDVNKHGMRVLGKEVHPPTSLMEIDCDIGAVVIPNFYWLEMVAALKKNMCYPMIDYNYFLTRYQK